MRRNRTQTIGWMVMAVICWNAGRPAFGQTAAANAEFFEKSIRPILVENCARCHSASSKPPGGGLRLDSRAGMQHGGKRGPLLPLGSPENSLLLRAIRYSDPALQMPPTGKLSAEQIGLLTEWMQRGAPWPAASPVAPASAIQPFDLKVRARHWAWQPVQPQAPPTVKQKSWPANDIDRFVLAKLEGKGMTPAASADKPTLLRRVTYDLTGLPPTPAELSAFLADPSPNAYEKVVDRLLASPHYGERWARHWLDLVRYAETDGHEWDIEKAGAYQYRDYLIRAFNADVPYNQFVTEQIAGDLMPHPRLHPTEGFNESALGTGFYWLGAGKHSPVDLHDNEVERIDNQIDVLGKAFLGVGIGCARCHDHKFDAISTRDYYALYGFLKSTRLQYVSAASPLRADRKAALEHLHSSLQTTARQAAVTALKDGMQAEMRDTGRLDAVRNAPESVLYPWAALSENRATVSAESFVKVREEVRSRLRSQAERAAQEEKNVHWLEGFGKDGTFGHWSVSGEAFGSGPMTALSARVEAGKEADCRAVFPPGVADSGRLSDRLHGTLRSPTFTITQPTILYHVAGENAHIRLIIHGYQRLRDPLYSRLELEIHSPDRLTWMTQDVRDWKGLRAYIEIEDSGTGFAALDRVGFAESGPPVDAPNPRLVQMLDEPGLTSLEALRQKYTALFQQTAEQAIHDPAAGAEGLARENLLVWALQTRQRPFADALGMADLLKQRSTLEAGISASQPALAAQDGDGENEPVHLRGSYRTPGSVVPRRFLEVCDHAEPLGSAPGSGRLQLAQRMTAPSDPLLARVMVNRLWQHHFGEGIVRTPDDFGVMGERPTHPELLDYLASEFVRQGWSLKKMHRLMLLSRTYRMSSQSRPQVETLDPQNRLLHRMPVRRLEAECIRDAVLASSGRLDPQLYGPPVMPYLNAFTPGRGAPASGPLDGGGRRSLYLSVRRNFLIPMFLAFDYPVPVTTQGRRTVSNVPSQALTLLNNPFVVEQAQVWAKHLMETPGTPEQRIECLYQTAFGRSPRPAERDASLSFVTAQGQSGNANDPAVWADLCHVLFNVKEFIFVY